MLALLFNQKYLSYLLFLQNIPVPVSDNSVITYLQSLMTCLDRVFVKMAIDIFSSVL